MVAWWYIFAIEWEIEEFEAVQLNILDRAMTTWFKHLSQFRRKYEENMDGALDQDLNLNK